MPPAGETYYYIAIRVKDARGFVPSVTRYCRQCTSPVLVDVNLVPMAEQATAIVCIPCVQEMTNLSVEDLFAANAGFINQKLGELLNGLEK